MIVTADRAQATANGTSPTRLADAWRDNLSTALTGRVVNYRQDAVTEAALESEPELKNKIVPIVTTGSSGSIGVAQVTGPEQYVRQVKAVAQLATDYKEAMEYASGGYLRYEIAEWRNLDEIYAREDGHRPTIEQYVRNRRAGSGWGEHGNADYPRLLREQNVVPMVDDGRIDEVWIFSDHFFGLWEASMAGPDAFFINGGVYPQVPSRHPFAFYGFNYERGVAEMIHNTAHRTEECSRCHRPEKSKSSGDVLLPNLASCRECHGDPGARDRIGTACVDCHGLHIARDTFFGASPGHPRGSGGPVP